tara:strand:- start:329 stop:994 length:666 start_codon:yes stop_codon:yes gene_type:complete
MLLIHQIFWNFKGKELNEIPIFNQCVVKTKEFCLHNKYEYKLWDLKDIEEMIIDFFPEYICLWTEMRYNIQRCDFARYMILYKYGGFYIDCDVYPVQNLTSLIHQKSEIFTTWGNDINRKPYNAVIYSEKFNILLIKIMEEVQRRVIEKQSMKIYDTWIGRLVFYTTGHRMLKPLVPKSSILDLLMIDNPEKGICISCENPYFYDQNISLWYDTTQKSVAK